MRGSSALPAFSMGPIGCRWVSTIARCSVLFGGVMLAYLTVGLRSIDDEGGRCPFHVPLLIAHLIKGGSPSFKGAGFPLRSSGPRACATFPLSLRH
jgi:hypothetical protein